MITYTIEPQSSQKQKAKKERHTDRQRKEMVQFLLLHLLYYYQCCYPLLVLLATWCYWYQRLAEEAKIAIVKVESITERVIVEAEPLLGPAASDLSPNPCSNPPKPAPQLPLPTHNHHTWIKVHSNHTHFLPKPT